MSSAEIKPGQDCGETEKIAKQLEKNFGDTTARMHLFECLFCRNSLGSKPSPSEKGKKIADLVNNFRNGIACSG